MRTFSTTAKISLFLTNALTMVLGFFTNLFQKNISPIILPSSIYKGKGYLKAWVVLLLLGVSGGVVGQTTLMSWDVNGQTSYGTQGLAPSVPTNIGSKLQSTTGLTRGAGVTTPSGAANNGWGGESWELTSAAAVTNEKFITFGLTPKSGYAISLTAFNPFGYRRSPAGADQGLFQFSIPTLSSGTYFGISANPVNFGNNTASGATNNIGLSGDVDLQEVTSSINLRLVPFGATSSNGTFYIYDTQSGSDFSISGRILGSTETALSSFSTCFGFPSIAQNFSVEGEGLTSSNVVLTAPTGYEISTNSSSGYSSSLSITPTSGSVNSMIYVRLTSAATAGTYSGNKITITGGGFTSIANLGVTLGGVVNPTPTAAVLSGTATICEGSSTNLSVAITGGTLPFSVVYNDGANQTVLSYETGDPISVNPTADQTYSLVSVTDSKGCLVAGAGLSGAPIITVNNLVAGSITGNETICSGGDPAISGSTAATGDGAITYTWEVNTNIASPSWGPLSGETGATLDLTTLSADAQYRRVATSTLNSIACTATSNVITKTVNNIEAGAITGTETICNGGDPAITGSTAATGDGTITYTWEVNTNISTPSWGPLSGETGATLDITSLTADAQYRRVATSTLGLSICTATSNIITKTVNNLVAGAITGDETICSGGDPAITGSMAATGDGTITYTWEVNTNISTPSWGPLSGETGATLDITSLTADAQYRRVATSTLGLSICTATSNIITKTVNNLVAGAITGDETICSGGDPTITGSTAATGDGTITYTWEVNTNIASPSWSQLSGETAAVLDLATLSADAQYRRVATSTWGPSVCTATSNVITITVNNLTSAGTITGDQTICYSGDPVAFTSTVGMGDGSISYRWESSIDDFLTAGSTISGASAATFDPPSGLIVSTSYRRIAISTLNSIDCESAPSDPIKVTVQDAVNPGVIAGDQTVCSGGLPVELTSTSAGNGDGTITYRWESKVGAGAWGTVSGTSDGLTYTTSSLTATTMYRRVAISTLNGVPCEAASNEVTLTVQSCGVTNTNTSTNFATIQAAINATTTTSGHTIAVAAGTYTELVTVSKGVTIKGANFGTSCTAARVGESIVAGGTGTAFTITSDGVTIDGFTITGTTGVTSTGFKGPQVKNNIINAGAVGISINNVPAPSGPPLLLTNISNNCVDVSTQVASSTPTVGILLNGITTEPLSIGNNNINGGFYGYLVHKLGLSPFNSIMGGTILGTMQGIAVVNTLDNINYFPSYLSINGVSMSGFTGSHPSLPAYNHHAGIYAFTGGVSATNGITLNVNNVTIDGTGKPNQASAGIYLGDFATGSGTFQTVTVTNSTIENNLNRGISARGKVSATITNSDLLNNGSDAFGTDGNDGFGIIALQGATVNVSNSKIVQPTTSTTLVTALMTGNGTSNSIVAHDNSITNPGNNAQARAAYLTAGTGTIDATCNWWGGIAGAVSPQITGAVTYEFFRTSGTDTDGSAAGFVPASGTCNGCSSGNLVTNTNTGEIFCTIQGAINDAQTLPGHTLEISSGNYFEQIVVNKQVKLKGVGTTKPVLDFAGTVIGKPTMIDIFASGVTIENLELKIDLNKLRSGIIASSSSLDEITIKDNTITAYGTAAGSYGDRNAVSVNYGGSTNYRNALNGVTDVIFTGNIISGTSPASYFRSGISLDEGGLIASNNTFTTINHDILLRFSPFGASITNNTFNGGGVELSDQNAGTGSFVVSNNTFTGAGAPNTAVLRLKNNYSSRVHSVSNNTFTNYAWGVSSENMNSVTFDANTFSSTTTTAIAIMVNTKSISSNSSSIVQVPVGGVFTNNNFNGSGKALLFANHDSDNDSYGTFTLGGSGQENNFASTLSDFIAFDSQTGASNTATFPLSYGNSVGWNTTMACWDQDFNADKNKFDIGAGLQLPVAMNFAERNLLETKLAHKPDNSCLGNIRYYFPIHNLTQNTYHYNIQEAIDAVSTIANDVIVVPAGTYSENVIVTKSVDIRGANYGISPNTGSRGPESIIVPATSGADALFTVQSSGVKIDGFLIDGDNTSITSTWLGTNGADIDAYDGIVYYDLTNTLAVNDLSVKNNIIQNIQYFGVDIYGWGNFNNPATTGHVVQNNLFKDLGTYSAGNGYDKWGGAVLLYNNNYANISDNETSNIRLGVQTGNFSKNSGGPTVNNVIQNNTFNVRRVGVFHNLHYSAASPFTISNNTITGIQNPNETGVRGILLGSLSVNSTVIGNNINLSGVTTNTSNGIEVWNVKSTTPAAISGGTISNVDTGIFINNYDGYSSDATDGAHATISGLSITPKTTGTGIRLFDNPLATTNAAVEATLGAGIILTGGTNGVVVENSTAKVNSPIGNVAFSGQSDDYIKLISNANDIDGGLPTFGGVLASAMTQAERTTLEGKLTHKFDTPTLGKICLPTKGTLSSSALAICAGNTVDLSVEVISATGPFTLVYTDGTTSVTTTSYTTGTPITITPSATSTYSIVSITDAMGCLTSSGFSGTPSVTVNALPSGTLVATETSGLTANDNTVCSGDAVTFTAPTGYANYNFKIGTTSMQSGTSNTYSPTFTVDGTVTVEITSAANCVVTLDPISITVAPCPIRNVTQNKNYATIQLAIDHSTTVANDVITVESGTYTENVTVSKGVTLKGAKFAVPCSGRTGAETVVNGGSGTAFNITADGVTIDGFTINGDKGVAEVGHSGLTVTNNIINAATSGVEISGHVTNSTKILNISDNCINKTGTAVNGGITLANISGPTAAIISGNIITGPTAGQGFGYFVYNLNTTARTIIDGGTISSFDNAINISNAIPTGPSTFSYAPSTLDVKDLILTGTPAISSAGINVFTGGSGTANKIIANISNVAVSGTGKVATDWAGLRFQDFSTGAGVRQDITVSGSNISNNKNRGIFARGANADIKINTSTISGNGADANGDGWGVLAGNEAKITLNNNFIENPSASTTTVHALGAIPFGAATVGGTVLAADNSILRNGNGKLATLSGASTITAACNWWGAICKSDFDTHISTGVTYATWVVSGTDGNALTGFQPEPLSCLNPTPIVDNTVNTTAVCSDVVLGAPTFVPNVGSVAIASYAVTGVVSTGLISNAGSSTTSDVSDDIWTNTTAAAINVVYTIVPTGALGCVGSSFTYTVSIKPEPLGVASVITQTGCSDTPISEIVLSTSNSLASTIYSWSRDNTTNVTGLATTGTTNISGIPNNVTGLTQTVVYTITPTNAGCSGNTFTTEVLVKPEPVGTVSVPTQTVCSDATISEIILGTSNSLSGTTYSWSRDKITEVTGLPLTGTTNISGIPNNVTGVPQTITYTITPTTDGCIGNTFTATVIVNPEPVGVATLSSQTVCSDIAISEIVLSTSNSISVTTYTWTRDKTTEVTGLASSGSGNIIGTPNNITGSSQTVTYTITPTSGTCVGNDFTATVDVKPEPVGVPTPLTQTVCSDENITPIALSTSNSLSGTTYSWSRDKLAEITGLASTGTANISGSGNNVTLANQTVTYTITPTFGGCVGNTFTSAITIKPEPNPVPTTIIQKCSAEPFTFDFDTYIQNNSADLGQVTYSYTVLKIPNLPLLDPDPAAGTQPFIDSDGAISNTITNFGTNPITVRYTATPTGANGCVGTSFIVNIVINPAPVVNIYPNGSDDLCAGESRIISGGVSPTGTYTNIWSIDSQTPGIGATLSSTGSISTSLIIPANAGAGTVVVKFLATNTATGCSNSTLYTFTVKEKPVITITTPSISNCEEVSTPGKAIFNFTAAGVSALPTTAGISYHTSASDAQNNLGTITNTTSFLGSNNQIIYVRATNGACFAVSTFTLIVNPKPAAPVVTTAAATCSANGTSTIVGYLSTNTYTFTPAATVTYSPSGLITGLTAGLSYTVNVTDASGCTSVSSASFSDELMLATPATPLLTQLTVVEPTCAVATGSITVTTPVSGMEYSLDGGAYSSTGIFASLTSDSYDLKVKNASGCESAALTVTIAAQPAGPAALTTANVTILDPTCTIATGTLTIIAPVLGMEYKLDGGAYQTSGVFASVASGTHTITVKNSLGCESAASASLVVAAQPVTPAAPVITTAAATCANNGTSTIVGYLSTNTYTFTPAATVTYSPAGLITGLTAGVSYTVNVTDAGGCTSVSSASFSDELMLVTPATPTLAQLTVVEPTCAVSTGSITVTAPVSGMEYSLDGGAYSSTGVFASVASGPHTIKVKNGSGCESAELSITISLPLELSPSAPVIASVVQPSCTVATGTINVTTVSGMTYKLDGGTAQASGTFATVASGSHTITAVNASGCESPITTVLINVAPSAPTAPVVASSTNPTCTLLGTITVTAVSGMEYSLNGGAYQTSGAFTSVAAGTYMVTAKNAAGCVSTGTEVILAPAPGSPSAPVIASVVQPSCTVATGTINVTTVSGMTYKLDGGTAQASGTFATVASGSHTITAVNASGCESPITTVLINVAPSAPTAPVVASSTNPTCTLLGTITVTAVSGMEYSLNGGAYQTSGAFTSVAAGTYMVTAKKAAGCVSTGTEVILAPAPGSPSAPVIASVVQPSCTVATGTINVTTVSGMTYKLDGGTAQASGTFATVASGSHTITAVNASGCESPITTVLINVAPSAPTAPVVASSTNPTCTLLGTITVTAVSGMEYSLNGGAYQTSGAFTSVAAGTYMVTAKNAAGCVSTGTEVILAPANSSVHY